MTPLRILQIALGVFTVGYVIVLIAGINRARREGQKATPTWGGLLVGFVTNFFDTLGIGSFAPTTAAFKGFNMVRDEQIPGTLNVGDTLPTIVQAFIFTTIINVDFTTLALLIGASVLGSWLGSGVVCSWNRRKIQIGMGSVLFAAALFFILKNVDAMRATPVFPGGTALALTGAKLGLGIAGCFMLGALMTLGIGMYAPCMILVSLLGMDPTAAFPIMMGSCAFLMPVSSARFVKENRFDLRAVIALFTAGIPAVLIAVYLVKQMDVTTVRWLVVVVVLITAVSMLRSAAKEKREADARGGAPATA